MNLVIALRRSGVFSLQDAVLTGTFECIRSSIDLHANFLKPS